MHVQMIFRSRRLRLPRAVLLAGSVFLLAQGCAQAPRSNGATLTDAWRLTSDTDPDANPAGFAAHVRNLGWGDGQVGRRRCVNCDSAERVDVRIDAAPGLATYDPRRYAGRAVLGRFEHLGGPGAREEQTFGVQPAAAGGRAFHYLVANAINADSAVTYRMYRVLGNTVTPTNHTGWLRLCHVDHNYGDRKRAKFMDCAPPASSSTATVVHGAADYDLRFQTGAESGWWECAGAGCCTTSSSPMAFNFAL